MESYDVQEKAENKSQHCQTGFFSQRENPVPLEKQQRTVHETRTQSQAGENPS